MSNMALAVIVAFALLALPAASQKETCFLDTAKDGQTVKFRGEAVSGHHDAIILPQGCPEVRVVLVDGDDKRVLGKATLQVRRDEAFRQFEEYLREQKPSKPNEICKLCPRYRVHADFEGRLDVAPSAGLKKNSKTGKVIGLEGFGHPIPFTRYRLVVTGISNVEASERDYPATVDPKDGSVQLSIPVVAATKPKAVAASPVGGRSAFPLAADPGQALPVLGRLP